MVADAMHGYYAARAPEYDRVYAKPERQSDLRAIEAWLPTVFEGSRLVEVACGTGYWSRFLAPVVHEMVGIDASVETLSIARQRVTAAHATFVVGDAYQLPATPGRFSAAFAGFWFSHIPLERMAAFLDGLHGTLTPGARVVFLDNRYVAGSSTAIADTDACGNTYQLRRLQDGSTHRVLKNFPSEQALRSAVEGVARRVRLHAWQHYWALEYVL